MLWLALVLLPSGCRRTPTPPPPGVSSGKSPGTSSIESSLVADRATPSAGQPKPATETIDTTTEPRLLDVPFEELHALLLLRKLSPGEKAALWPRYYHRWVRWRGRLVRRTAAGAAFRVLPETATFDVSLLVEPAGRERLSRYHIGDEIPFVGRLERYDPVFFRFQLSHGDVPEPAAVTKPH